MVYVKERGSNLGD